MSDMRERNKNVLGKKTSQVGAQDSEAGSDNLQPTPRRQGLSIGENLRKMLSNRQRNILGVSLFAACASIVGLLSYLYLAINSTAWQHYALVGLTVVLLIVSLISAVGAMSREHPRPSGIWLLLIVGQISIALSPLFAAQLAIWYAAGIMLSTLIISTLTLSGRQATLANLAGALAGVIALLMDSFLQTYQLQPPIALQYFIPAVAIFLALFYAVILILFFTTYTLRAKITVVVFSAALLSIIVLAASYSYMTRQELLASANRTLLLSAEATRSKVDDYLKSLITALENSAANPTPYNFLRLSVPDRMVDLDTNTYLGTMKTVNDALNVFLFDQDWNVILTTLPGDPGQLPLYMGVNDANKSAMQNTFDTGAPFLSTIVFPDNAQEDQSPYFYVGARVVDLLGKPIGFLAATFSLSELQKLITDMNGMAGPQSFSVLLDDNYMRIIHGAMPEEANYKLVYPLSPEQIIFLQVQGRLPSGSIDEVVTNYPEYKAGLDQLPSGNPFFSTQEISTGDQLNRAAGVGLENQSWYLVTMEPESVILQPITQQNRTTVLIAVFIGGLTILGSTLLAQIITNPVVRLTGIAEQAAGGNLNLEIPVVQSQDEIGTLSTAFHSMTTQLRQTLEGLEQRVSERTAELAQTSEQMQHRAERLQMVAEVAHTLAAVQDPNVLLPLVAETISKQFGYYHVGIFLLDKDGQYAVLQAANSEGGKRMLARGHRLKVGEVGIVGYVAGKGQARIALDVGKDAVFFDNPDLPMTRSEIALPMKSGTRITGALDVQSTEPQAFTQDDIALLSTLADQVAMAIENARLFSETQRTLRELQVAQRQYLRQEWEKAVSDRQHQGYRYNYGQLTPLSGAEEPDKTKMPAAWTATQEDISSAVIVLGRDADKELTAKGQQGLLIPITLRGEVIGVIDLEETDASRQWGEEEITLAKAVADQVGLALENARLLEATQRRAERERLVADITTKLRSSNDLREILETAVVELKHALRVRSVQVHVPGAEVQRGYEE
jgi:GAF domain-containing protein/HAMP domain-containing protein